MYGMGAWGSSLIFGILLGMCRDNLGTYRGEGVCVGIVKRDPISCSYNLNP